MPYTLAVVHNLVRQRAAYQLQSVRKRGTNAVVHIHPARARSQQKHRVVGGRVPIDRDRIERPVYRRLQHRRKLSRRSLQIREQVHQHRRVRRPGREVQAADESSRRPWPFQKASPARHRHRSLPAPLSSLVSVVRIAVANCSACADVAPTTAFSPGSAATIFSPGSGTPMMPVEDGNTSSKIQPNVSAAARQVSRQTRTPGSPVAQLALPAFTSTAPTRPPVASRCRRPTITGAATTRLRVNMAAAVAPCCATATARSALPLALMPARTAPHKKPAGNAARHHRFRHRCFSPHTSIACARSAELSRAISSSFTTAKPASGGTACAPCPSTTSHTFA